MAHNTRSKVGILTSNVRYLQNGSDPTTHHPGVPYGFPKCMCVNGRGGESLLGYWGAAHVLSGGKGHIGKRNEGFRHLTEGVGVNIDVAQDRNTRAFSSSWAAGLNHRRLVGVCASALSALCAVSPIRWDPSVGVRCALPVSAIYSDRADAQSQTSGGKRLETRPHCGHKPSIHHLKPLSSSRAP